MSAYKNTLTNPTIPYLGGSSWKLLGGTPKKKNALKKNVLSKYHSAIFQRARIGVIKATQPSYKPHQYAEATLLGCKCADVGIHLNRECGLKYLKNLRRPNQALTVCEVCQSPMSEFAEKIQPVLSTSESESPFSLHDRDGFIHTLTRPRRRPSEWCEFFCFLVPCLPCIALASTNCFHFLCVSAMRFRAYIFLGVILAVMIIFLSDVYLSMESKFKSREREQRKDTYDTGNDSGYNSDYYHHSGWRGRESRPMFGGRGGGWNSFYYDA